MNISALFPLIILLFTVFLWGHIYARNLSRPVNKAYLYFNAFISIWLFFELLSWTPIQEPFLYYAKTTEFISWLPIGFLYVHFIYTVLSREKDWPYYTFATITGISLLIGSTTNALQNGYTHYYWGVKSVPGYLYIEIIVLAFVAPFIYSIYLLIRASQKVQGDHKSTILLIIYGSVFSLAIGGFSDIIIPHCLGHKDFPSIAGSSSAILSLFLFIAIRKHRFLVLDLESAAYDLFNNITDAILIIDTNGLVRQHNPAAHTLFEKRRLNGFPVDQLFSKYQLDQHYEDFETYTLDSKRVSLSQAPIRQSMDFLGLLIIIRDLTKRQLLRQEMEKRQRLESIGLLAGGIAHDFNNLLTAVISNLGIAKMDLEADHPAFEVVDEAEEVASNAIHLTRQLLTFSKGGDPIKEIISPHDILEDLIQFSLRGSKVSYEINIEPDIWFIEVDKGQLSQAINNLVINAKQAMNTGGKITVNVTNINKPPAGIGDEYQYYISMSFIDQGHGIEKKNLRKIFDPYFSTKTEGSGLGLASTYSIIKRHHGHITVESTVGKGTCFTIFLPAIPDILLHQGPPTRKDVTNQQHEGKILIMDDEAPIRESAFKILSRLGYMVSTAKDGQEALDLFRQAIKQNQPFDLVIMDLTVPGGMGGQELMANLLKIDPDVSAIVSSGYSNDPVMANYHDYGFKAVIPKPFTLEEYTITVKEILS